MDDRYRFEEARNTLNRFVESKWVKDNDQFQRAYRKLLGMIAVYAFVDFGMFDVDKESAQAWAWEDAEITFRGFGEAALTGAVLQLWISLPERKEAKKFKRALVEAFRKADEATSGDVQRRYLTEFRDRPIRTLKEGFDEPAIVPNWGPKAREYALSKGIDPDYFERQFRFIEMADRDALDERKAKAEKDKVVTLNTKRRNTFRCLDGGKDD